MTLQDDPVGSLAELGISVEAEGLYRDLVATGPLRTDLGRPGASVDQDVDVPGDLARELVERGLAHLDADGMLVPLPPRRALTPLVSALEDAAEQAREALEELAETHRTRSQEVSSDKLEIIRGAEAIAGWIDHLQERTTEQIRFLAKPPFSVAGLSTTDAELRLTERRVRQRIIIARALLEEPGAEEEVLASMDRGQELRMATSVPAKLMISDDQVGIVQFDDGGPDHDTVLVVRPGGLLTALTALFEREWEHAIRLRGAAGRRVEPFPAPAEELPDEEDRRVLALLLVGHTDASVAARLGVGTRTVQRRVRRLMDMASTDSRILLGWYARDRGWL